MKFRSFKTKNLVHKQYISLITKHKKCQSKIKWINIKSMTVNERPWFFLSFISYQSSLNKSDLKLHVVNWNAGKCNHHWWTFKSVLNIFTHTHKWTIHSLYATGTTTVHCWVKEFQNKSISNQRRVNKREKCDFVIVCTLHSNKCF